ncbi:MAG TPA: DUF1707 domain-containing protein [Pseudonocardia sp.]|nr:DUF1707 domain-containing protein [Pseudonocardia sp.]
MTNAPDPTRVSDADRERVAGVLHDAVGTGRLTLAEVDERLRATYAAVTRHDLAAVTADLTPPGPAAPRASARPARSAEQWRGWLGGALLMIGIWALTSLAAGHALFFWPVFPLAFWALSLAGGRHPGRGCAALPRS